MKILSKILASVILLVMFSLLLGFLAHFFLVLADSGDLTKTPIHVGIDEAPETTIQSVTKCAEIEVIESYITRYGVRNELATKAFKMSGGDMDFLKTVEMESKFDPKAVGDHGKSKGLCQWHYTWQKAVRNDPNFNDPDWQLQKCFEFYTGYLKAGNINSRLYGYRNRHLKNDVFKVVTYTNTVSVYKCE